MIEVIAIASYAIAGLFAYRLGYLAGHSKGYSEGLDVLLGHVQRMMASEGERDD